MKDEKSRKHHDSAERSVANIGILKKNRSDFFFTIVNFILLNTNIQKKTKCYYSKRKEDFYSYKYQYSKKESYCSLKYENSKRSFLFFFHIIVSRFLYFYSSKILQFYTLRNRLKLIVQGKFTGYIQAFEIIISSISCHEI
jgi:hypothetical protein